MSQSSIDAASIFVSEGLAGAGKEMNRQAEVMVEELNTLKKKLIPLVESWRRSEASTYFQDMQNEWDIAANGLFGPDGVLGRIAHAMDVNWGNYAEAEWSNVRTWKH
ncbi:WXG100 family type VII secretion target [Streptomyces sp. NPDC048281]|uniref:WXG100 family type VII secretion target n=1 Tax=Streptomyces sp. NPDC048281 TaxID=3154715 RepID=UPI00341EB363